MIHSNITSIQPIQGGVTLMLPVVLFAFTIKWEAAADDSIMPDSVT